MNNKNNMLKPEEKEKNSKKDIYPGNLPQNYQKNIILLEDKYITG